MPISKGSGGGEEEVEKGVLLLLVGGIGPEIVF